MRLGQTTWMPKPDERTVVKAPVAGSLRVWQLWWRQWCKTIGTAKVTVMLGRLLRVCGALDDVAPIWLQWQVDNN